MTMQEAMMSQELANLDLSKVAALQQKRTLAFVNHFVITTVQFFNNFMKKCEHKLMLFERKLEKVEAAMVLLEARLSSIPEVNAPQTELKQDTTSESKRLEADHSDQESNTSKEFDNTQDTADNAQEHSATDRHPEYDRFVKMVQVGVPVQAVKLKISLEGLDPNVLDKILSK